MLNMFKKYPKISEDFQLSANLNMQVEIQFAEAEDRAKQFVLDKGN